MTGHRREGSLRTDLTGHWIDEWLAGLVHRSSLNEPAERARQERFVISRTVTSLVSLVALPLSLLGQAASELFVYWGVLTLTPLVAVFILSRWGRIEAAQALVSLALTLSVAQAMASNGGSLVMTGCAVLVVPLEATISGSRRGFIGACVLALVGLPIAVLLHGTRLAEQSLPLPAIFAITGAIALGHAMSRVVMDRKLDAVLDASQAGAAREGETLLAIDDLVTWHDANGVVLRSNGASTRLLGAPPAAVYGNGLFTRIHVADRPLFLKAVSDVANGANSAVIRFRVQAGDVTDASSLIWVETRVHRLTLRGDDACAAVAVTRDITEHRLRADELDAMRRDAVSANEGRAQLLATVSHELRTPLNAIIGYSEILMGRGGPSLLDQREGYAEIIHHSGQHMLGVVDTLLDLSAIEAGRYDLAFEEIDVADLIRECCGLVALAAQRGGIVLTQQIAPGLPELVADRRACRQILLNLLSNAVKFTPQGGQVTVEARCDGDNVALAVRDTGIGVPEADLPRLGMPFYQGTARSRAEKGNGLGLSVVRGLVALHQGHLRIASAPGNGTCVKINLPADARHAAAVKGLVPAAARTNHDVIVLKTG
ncbi:sensor histidine kinase [Microvirga alba]|uniref:histidine kinase n=1 Tax=Microvirga alba TaxID=2791025 RepID=A0A931BIX0_9HYPH|nr:PAS domain-containing sensor histidine kinase [Microvirga alba]MBF9232036.1 PAS domain-containing sensor histidine kinase [Microvirga alba]